MADIAITCSDSVYFSYANTIGTPDYSFTAGNSAGFQSVTVMAGTGAIAQFAGIPAAASGNVTTLTCAAGSLLVGVHLNAYVYSDSPTQQAM